MVLESAPRSNNVTADSIESHWQATWSGVYPSYCIIVGVQLLQNETLIYSLISQSEYAYRGIRSINEIRICFEIAGDAIQIIVPNTFEERFARVPCHFFSRDTIR